MPTVRPFSALRYDVSLAGPLADLVAPPYDVISAEQRREYLERSPYNVVHLTLPDSEEQAARDLADWRARGVLAEAPAGYWWVAQDYVGPDGVARTREGFAASVPVTPYAAGDVLPHERTHAGPKEGRLRLLRATRTQLEPIFLLYDAEPVLERPAHDPAVDVEEGGVRTRMWPVAGDELTIATPLLIADGHHRYETAVAYREENPAATHTFAILVSSRAPGLEIFPTHRVVQEVGEVPGEPIDAPDGGVTLYRGGRYLRVRSDDDFGPRVVESLRPQGVTYTPSAREAIATVDRGDAQAAFLLQPVTVEQVARFARARGAAAADTTAIDAAAERAILRHFEGFRIVSEEAGISGDAPYTVVVDPIDGSLNAKRGIPFFSLSIAVAEGHTMGDVVFGYVHDFGTGEEWTATRGGGAQLNGAPLAEKPKDELEILSFEATTTAYVAENAVRFGGVAHRLRIMGSLAITLCHLAAGRVDGVVSLKPARSVDIAAAQLLVVEQGLAIALPDEATAFDDAPLDLEGRSRVAAAGNDELCRRLATALTA